MQTGADMLKSIAIILVASALGGCAADDFSSRGRSPENSFALDGLGPDPSEPPPSELARTRRPLTTKKPVDVASSMASMRDDDAKLDAYPKYSKEWVALYVAKQKRDDAKLTRAMIICRGC
jgi:hypothetical protein